MAPINWALYTERAIGKGHPTLAQTIDRALRQLLTESGYDPDASSFPGLLGPVFNVVAFSSPQAAISAAEAVGGGYIVFPVGLYSLSTELLIQKSGINLLGMGSFYNPVAGGATLVGTRFTWAGASGGTMVRFRPATSGTAIKRSGMKGISLFGNDVAGFGVVVESVQGGTFDQLYIQDCTNVMLDMNVITPLAENGGVTRCTFKDINTRVVSAGSNSSIGVRLDGNVAASPSAANVSNNSFHNLEIVHMNGVGLQMNNCDDNRFYGVDVNRGAGGTGIGIELGGSNTAEAHCRANAFYQVSPGAGGMTARGAGFSNPSEQNVVHDYSVENAEPIPVIEAGTSLWYTTTDSPRVSQQITLASNITWTNMGSADSELLATTAFRTKLDLRSNSQFRLIVVVATAGAAGADLRCQYSLNNGSSFADELDGAAGPEVSIAATGMQDSGWINIVDAARVNNTVLRIVGKDGDAVADPVFSVQMLFR